MIPLHGRQRCRPHRGARDTEPPGRARAEVRGRRSRSCRRRLTGDYEVDEFGFDPDSPTASFMPMLRLLYEQWFRVEVSGIENVPDEGGA